MPEKLVLKSVLSPGDAVVLTATVESLHTLYPGEYITDVVTSTPDVWNYNPNITTIAPDDSEARIVEVHYPIIHDSKKRFLHFLHGYCEYLSTQIGKPLYLTTNRPHLYLSQEERDTWMDQVQEHAMDGRKREFWLVNAGTKKDYTTKQWPIEYYQKVIDETSGYIQWVQVGAKQHEHHPLRGVLDFRGKTTDRQLIRLAYHCSGGLGPTTYLQHLCAAFEKPYCCLLGGREDIHWVQYPRQTTFHTIGQLPCCLIGGCWKSRVVPLRDNDEKNKSLCEQPLVGYMKPVPTCMAVIKPDEVIRVIQRIIALAA